MQYLYWSEWCVCVWLGRMISRGCLITVIGSYSSWVWLDLGCNLEYQKDRYDTYILYNMIIVSVNWGFFLTYLFIYLCIYFWLCWVFASVRGLSPAAASGGHSSSRCAGLSPSRPLLLRSTGSRRAGSAVVAHGPSRSAACEILPDQGSNPRPLHWQADSQPLCHQGSPNWGFDS